MKLKVTNVCFKGNTNSSINISFLSCQTDEVKKKYTPRKFPGLVLFFKNGTCLLFKSGYYSICGCKAIDDGVKAQNELFDYLKNYNFEIKNVELKLTNICGSFDCFKPINLVKLAIEHPQHAVYDIEIFPAVKYRLDQHVFTVHHTGKVFVTGLKTYEDLSQLCEKMFSFLKTYIKSD